MSMARLWKNEEICTPFSECAKVGETREGSSHCQIQWANHPTWRPKQVRIFYNLTILHFDYLAYLTYLHRILFTSIFFFYSFRNFVASSKGLAALPAMETGELRGLNHKLRFPKGAHLVFSVTLNLFYWHAFSTK